MNDEIISSPFPDNPVINEDYIRRILRLPDNEKIICIDVTDTAESNTAHVIKVSAQIRGRGGDYIIKIFVKTNKNRSGNAYHDISMKEGAFYKFISDNPANGLPVPQVNDVYLSEEKNEFVIALEDISDRYDPPGDSALTDKNTWFACAESLARFHSVFWNRATTPREKNEEIHDDDADRECLHSFLNVFNDRFDERIKIILKQSMEINISLIHETSRRIKCGDNFTICNGDSHIGNFMLPKNKNDQPMMIDFQFWGEGIGTGDLAHLTRDRFPDDFKRDMQLPLVEHYFRSLLSYGVKNYTREKCLYDYRTSVASMVLIPLWQYSGFGLNYGDWIGDLKTYADNYEYMRCDEIFREL